jgi:parallel beta-helix repeat protein
MVQTVESDRRFSLQRHRYARLVALLALFAPLYAFAVTPAILDLSSNSTCAQIQTALDNAPPGAEVVLSAGTYQISQPLLLRHNDLTLRGSGPGTILYLTDNADCPVVILGPPMNETKHPATHLRLADLVIDGNRKNQSVELWRSAGDGSEINNNGIQVWNVADATVEHVVCCRCRSGGLVTAGVTRLLVNGFDAYDNQFDGLACYQTADSRFDDLHLHDNLAAGISLDLDFHHNSISNAVLANNDLGIFMRDSQNNSFRGLTISKSHNHGVFMAQTAAPTDKGWQLSPDTQCIGNQFEDLVVNDCGGKAFQVNDASCTNNMISGAHFLRNLLGGLGEPAANIVSIKALVDR